MTERSFACVLSLALLTGCATATFKRGASPGAMAADERACRSTTTDESAYTACLRERGWSVSGNGAARDVKDTETMAHTAPGEAATPRGATAATGIDASDPMKPIGVASWWKLGGNPAGLDRAIDACVGELGAAHRPNPSATVVTAGLRACLNEAGWHAVGESAAR